MRSIPGREAERVCDSSLVAGKSIPQSLISKLNKITEEHGYKEVTREEFLQWSILRDDGFGEYLEPCSLD